VEVKDPCDRQFCCHRNPNSEEGGQAGHCYEVRHWCLAARLSKLSVMISWGQTVGSCVLYIVSVTVFYSGPIPSCLTFIEISRRCTYSSAAPLFHTRKDIKHHTFVSAVLNSISAIPEQKGLSNYYCYQYISPTSLYQSTQNYLDHVSCHRIN